MNGHTVQDKRDVAEQIAVGVLIFVLSGLAGWGLDTLKARQKRRLAEEKRRRKGKEAKA